MKKAVFFFTLIFPLIFFTNLVKAHGEGASFEREVEGYVVDIGYEPEAFMAGEPTIFDFNLVDAEKGEDIEFSDIWVRISQGTKTFFASGLHKASIGRTVMTYIFPEGGEYEFSVRFQNKGESLVEISFPITVEEVGTDIKEAEISETGRANNYVIGGLSGILVGSVLTLILTRKKSKKEE